MAEKYFIKKYKNGVTKVTHAKVDDTAKDKSAIGKFKRINKNMGVYTDTGEVVEFREPETKRDSVRSVQKSMWIIYDKLMANIDVKEQKCYFVTLTMADIVDIEHFEKYLESYQNRLSYYYNKKFIYAYFKEANADGRYHAHAVIAFDKDIDESIISDPLFAQYWRYGQVETARIETSEDLVKILFYVCNYSRPFSNPKVARKIACLEYFPPNKHLVKMTRGLKEENSIVTDDPSPYINDKLKLCGSTRINGFGRYDYSTFTPYDDEKTA